MVTEKPLGRHCLKEVKANMISNKTLCHHGLPDVTH